MQRSGDNFKSSSDLPSYADDNDPELKFLAHLPNSQPKTKEEAKQRIEEVARIFEMTPEEYRMHCFNRIFKNEVSLGYLIQRGYARKLNIIFDIDHTLVFSLDANQFPQLVGKLPKINICNILLILNVLGGGLATMLIVVREGVIDMLEYLSDFCNFYVYSHGMKEYIMKILEVIDPSEKYFKDRDRTVIAPLD